MEDYGEYHLDGYKIKSNKFTKKWNIKAGTRVPRRNFLISKSDAKGSGKFLSDSAKTEMYKKINKAIRTKTKSMR